MALRAMALKAGDQWVIPICRRHHDAVENAGDEIAWWARMGIDPVPLALELWRVSKRERRKPKPPLP